METPNSVAFNIFGLDILWYGVLVSLSIALVVVIICLRAPRHHEISSDKALNFCIILVIVGVIGARLYYVLFNWSYYAEDFSRILNTRGGGLAIHGGLIAGAIAALILCRFWKERPLNILDLCFAVIPLGQAIGRWGNFFNGEAHGGPTDLPWGVIIDGTKYHPTFLYESIWCFLLFIFLVIIDNRRKFEGQTFLLYAILYSIERFIVEGMRTDSLMLFGVFKQAQVLSVILLILGIIAYIFLSKRPLSDPRIESVIDNPVLDAIDDIEDGLAKSRGSVEDAVWDENDDEDFIRAANSAAEENASEVADNGIDTADGISSKAVDGASGIDNVTAANGATDADNIATDGAAKNIKNPALTAGNKTAAETTNYVKNAPLTADDFDAFSLGGDDDLVILGDDEDNK